MGKANDYCLRGNRVEPLTEDQIRWRADQFCQYLKINRHTARKMDSFLEGLSRHEICIDPIDTKDWVFVTDAICTPEDFTIRLPESSYMAACMGNKKAIELIFHELGHLVLCHKTVFHNEKSEPPSIREDAEWQADKFAEFVLARMGIFPAQLELDFDSL